MCVCGVGLSLVVGPCLICFKEVTKIFFHDAILMCSLDQMPMPLTLKLVLHQSKKSKKNAAPFAEYLPGIFARVMCYHEQSKFQRASPVFQRKEINYELCTTVFEGAVLRVLNLKLAAICLAHQQLSLHEAVTSLVLPALTDQLLAMRDRVLQEFVDHTKVIVFACSSLEDLIILW